MIFSFQTGTCINQFQAHDDLITSILFYDAKLISPSLDQSIKIWDLKQPGYEDDPAHAIFDHDDEIVTADIRQNDGLLATMDATGTVIVRSLKVDIEQVLY